MEKFDDMTCSFLLCGIRVQVDQQQIKINLVHNLSLEWILMLFIHNALNWGRCFFQLRESISKGMKEKVKRGNSCSS